MHRLAVFSIAFSVLMCVVLFLVLGRTGAGGWDNYHLVVVKGDLALFHERMEGLPVSEILSAQTAQVELQAFSSMHTLSVSELPQRLDAEDPRYDPYLRAVFSLFQGEGGAHVVYIRDEIGKFRLWRELTVRLGDMSWHMVDFSLFSIIMLGAVVVVSVLLMYKFPHLWMMIVLQSIALCIAAYHLPVLGIIPLLLMKMGWVYIYDRLCTGLRALRAEGALGYLYWWIGCGILMWGMSLLVMGLLHVRLLVPGTLIALQQLGLAGFMGYRHYLRMSLTEHPLFTPAQFITRTSFSLRPGSVVGIPVVLYLVFMILSLLLPDSPGSQMVPSVTRAMTQSINQFPTRDEYLAHRAFQLTLPFGGEYRVPISGERVEIAYFYSSGRRTVKDQQVIMEWTDEWIQEQLRPVTPHQAANILLYQKENTQIISAVSIAVARRPITVLVFTVLTLIVFGFFCFPVHPRARGSVRQWMSFAGILRIYGK